MCRVGTAGLIYAAIVVAWLAYLVPQFLRRTKVEDTEQAIRPLGSGVRMVRRDHADDPVADGAEAAGVSTPLTRRAGLRELRELDQLAARRRRNVLTALMFAVSVVLALCVAEVTPWWALAIPGGLVIAFFAAARVSVVFLRRDLDRRRERLLGGDEEETVEVSAEQLAKLREGAAVEGVALGVPDDLGGQLWDPLPITAPTYVSRPAGGRSVRTIDLATPANAPAATDAKDRPVTADEPTEAIERSGSTQVRRDGDESDERPRAVGE